MSQETSFQEEIKETSVIGKIIIDRDKIGAVRDGTVIGIVIEKKIEIIKNQGTLNIVYVGVQQWIIIVPCIHTHVNNVENNSI